MRSPDPSRTHCFQIGLSRSSRFIPAAPKGCDSACTTSINFNRAEFLQHYHKRSNVESTFSMIEAKFCDHVRSKTDVAMVNEVLCKIVCHNICS